MNHRVLLSRWAGLLLLCCILIQTPARAQTSAPDSTATATPDSAAVGTTGGALTPPPAGLPSAEFETYNVDGSGLRYTAALTGLFTTGTVERTYFSTSHTANLAVGHWLLPAALSYSYGRQSGTLRERELLLLTTPAYRLRRWKFYLLGEYETSNLRAIAHREVAGGGVGYQVYADTTHNEMALSTFLLAENTLYDTEPPLQRRLARNSTRLKLRLNQGNFSASELLFYQPALAAPTTDYRVNSASVLAFRLYQHLALNLAYTFSYESIVVQDRSRANSTLSVGFAYSSGN